MSFCIKCGKELSEDAAFCSACGTPTTQTDISAEQNTAEEQKFLDLTHRFLRWEQKAWKIFGIFFLVAGIFYSVFSSIYILIGLAALAGGEEEMGSVFTIVGLLFLFLFGSIFFGLFIVHRIAAKKIQLYLDTLYTDFSLTYKRCGSIGMLIFTALFSEVAFIFFLINFIRMKSNKELAEKCMASSSHTT